MISSMKTDREYMEERAASCIRAFGLTSPTIHQKFPPRISSHAPTSTLQVRVETFSRACWETIPWESWLVGMKYAAQSGTQAAGAGRGGLFERLLMAARVFRLQWLLMRCRAGSLLLCLARRLLPTSDKLLEVLEASRCSTRARPDADSQPAQAPIGTSDVVTSQVDQGSYSNDATIKLKIHQEKA